ncbi:hypothetical protein Hanom_Chr11g00988601 [Helianthus anomalus]
MLYVLYVVFISPFPYFLHKTLISVQHLVNLFISNVYHRSFPIPKPKSAKSSPHLIFSFADFQFLQPLNFDFKPQFQNPKIYPKVPLTWLSIQCKLYDR